MNIPSTPAAASMTGAGTSMARGFPDLGLLGLTEMVENAGAMARTEWDALRKRLDTEAP